MRAVNLLPPDTRGASKASAELGAGPEATGGAGAFVVLGVLAACVAGVAGHVLINNTIKQRQADLAEVTQRAQALQSQANQLKPYADFDSMAKARVQTVKDLAGSRFDWEQTLRDLARAIPANVTLKSLTGDISTDAGGGGSTLRTAIAAPAITITGCAPEQREVARLMARLHDIDGVTRVSLSKSAAEEIATSGRHAARPGPSSSGATPPRAGPASVPASRWSCSSSRTPPPSRRRRRPRRAPSARRRLRRRRRTPPPRPPPGTEGTSAAPRPPPRPRRPREGRPREPLTRIAIAVVACGGAVYGYWKVDVAPKRAEAAKLEQEVATQQAQLAQTQALIQTYEGARAAYKDNYAKVVRLGKAIPSDDDTKSLVVQLDASAKRSDVDFDSLNVNGSGAPATDGSSPLAPGAVNAGSFSAMPFSLSFTGDFEHARQLPRASRALRHAQGRGDRRQRQADARREDPAPPRRQGLAGPPGPDRRQLLHRPRKPGRGRPRRGRRHHRRHGHDDGHRHLDHDRRDRNRDPMNLITDPFRGLVQRKLWPVALLLVGALVAVPVVLSKAPTTAPAASPNAKKTEAIPATFVTAAEDADDTTSAGACWAPRRTRSSRRR